MLSTAQAGEIIGCSATTVKKLCQTGKLRARKLGTMWLISAEDAFAFREIDRKPYWFRNSKALDKHSASV